MENKTILFVDDEQNILRAFRRVFMDREYRILLANSGQEALELLKTEKVDLLVSDMKMPYMDGYELLSIIKKEYPKIARIILSGFSEKETMIQCIQSNLAMIYLLKPWQNEQLLLTLRSTLKLQQILEENNMEEVANSLVDTVTVREKLSDELLYLLEKNVELESIVGLIEKDFILSAIILRYVNSTFYGKNISSVRHALKYFSPNELKNIILSKKLNQTIDGNKGIIKLKNYLWKHANLRNKITHYIYREILGKEIPEEYRLAGLLHSIGMLVLLKIYHSEYVDLVHEACLNCTNLLKLEKERYGLNHQEAGGYLLDWWGIPFPIVETAFYHHNPQSPDIVNTEIINAVYMSDYYTWILTGQNPPEPCSDAIYNSIGTTKEICDSKIFKDFYTEASGSNVY
ncbi:MAG TPA: HDOD domain-containing protein [Patescibacteria group bacterium]|nr:HDOD domain-containing protein [Patescibacteria group bacterium]